MIRIIPFILALLGAAAAHAQVYKCVDVGGKVVYSQVPCPPNTKSERMGRSGHAASTTAAPSAEDGKTGAAKKGADPKLTPEQAFQKRQQDQRENQKKTDEKTAQVREKEENCRRSKDDLTQYEIGGRITRFNSQGERYYLEDAQIEQEKARARALVSQWCN